MSNIVYIATSLDGFIARKDDTIEWLMDLPNPTQSDYGFAEFMAGIDAILIGRRTFDTVLTFGTWPYTKPVFVLSRTLKVLPEHVRHQATLLSGAPTEITARLRAQGCEHLYIDGGNVIQGFLRDNLIDEMTITRVPILLGSGIPLFGNDGAEVRFRHVETVVFNNVLVRSKYVRE